VHEAAAAEMHHAVRLSRAWCIALALMHPTTLKNLAPKNAVFHPDEAHFTLRQIPK
jgi:hypothetical protein